MKLSHKLSISAVSVAVGLAAFFGIASAATPTLSVGQPDTHNIVRITINNADPFATVGFYQQQSNGPLIFVSNYGQTDASGFFSQLASLSTDGSNNAITEYVIINGQRSNTVTVFPSGSNGNNNNGAITLSQTSLSLNAGQNASVNVSSSNYPYNSFYITNNNNSSVASATVSGNVINVFGNSAGSTTFTVCQTNNSQCASLFVTVNGSTTGNITFSNTYPSVNVGQNVSVNVFSSNSNNNSFYVSNNSNTSVALTNISGNILNIQGLNSGSATITVCQYNNNQCGYVYVNVNGTNSGNFTLSQTNLNMNVGQTSTVTAVNPNAGFNAFNISSNSNPNIVSANISGNTITLYALNYGSSTISICQNNGGFQCQTLFVNVNNNFNNSGSVTFSPVNPVLNVGQTMGVLINGNYGYNTGYYISSNSNINVASATISGSTLNILGNSAGSTSMNICQYNSNQCGTIFITVNGGNVLGASIYKNGTLINDGGAIYITYKNTKAGFANMTSFTGLGYKMKDVINASTSNLSNTGYVIATPYVAHPWGTWIINGSTIYFEDQYGLIPVSDWNVFLNNGGSNTMIVQANSYDMQRPILSVMVNSDTRLR